MKTTDNMSKASNYRLGNRVQAHPATGVFMMGDRYGEVVRIGRKLVKVKMDRSGKVRSFHPDNLLFV